MNSATIPTTEQSQPQANPALSGQVENRNQERYAWVDRAKGLGIILVVVSHAPLPLELKAFLFSFHMPLFFWLAGLFFQPAQPFGKFAGDKARRLLWPYLAWGLAAYGVWLGIRPFSHAAQQIEPWIPLVGLLTGIGAWMPQNTPLWFLPCLFCTLLLLYGIIRLPIRGIFLALPFSALIGWLFFQANPVYRLPGSLDVALSAVVFAAAGYLYRQHFLKTRAWPWLTTLALSGWWLAATAMNAALIGLVDMNNGHYGNFFLFYAAAFSGLLVTINLAKRLTIPILQCLGQASLTIFCTHMLVFLLVTITGKKLAGIPIDISYAKLMDNNPAFGPTEVTLVVVLYVLAGLLVPLGLSLLYSRSIKPRLMRPAGFSPAQQT